MATATALPAGGKGDAAQRPGAGAAELLAAFHTVVKLLERLPLPADAATRAQWQESPPAPRHVVALMRVVTREGMSVSELAAGLGVSLATASQVVTDLEASELLERYTDPTDRRRTLLRVAAAHRQIADALLDVRLRPVQRALDRLRPADRRGLIRGLELVAEELESVTR